MNARTRSTSRRNRSSHSRIVTQPTADCANDGTEAPGSSSKSPDPRTIRETFQRSLRLSGHTCQEIERMGRTYQWKLRAIAVLLLLGGLYFQIPRAAAANDPQVTSPVIGGPVIVRRHHNRFLYRVGPSPTPFLRLLAATHLTPQQRHRIGRIMRISAFRSMTIFRQLHIARERIADKLLGPGPVFPADLTPLERRAEKLQLAMDRNMMHTALAIRHVLTAKQLAHAAKVHRKLRALRKQIEELLGPGPEASFMGAPR